MTESSFGSRLRAQRERCQLSLSTIAEQTKIRLPLLEQLEQDDVSHWPGGIFRRSYLRSYARAIGLDPEDTLREFLELHPDPEEDPTVIAQALANQDDAPRRPPTRLQYLINSAIGALPQMFHGAQKEADANGPGRPAPAAVTHVIRVPRVERVPRPEPASYGDAHDDNGPRVERPVDPVAGSSADSAPPVELPVHAPEPAVRNAAQPEPSHAGRRSADLVAIAGLCTRLAQASAPEDVTSLMADAARLLRASGLLLWLWDPKLEVLWPSFSHGYSADVLAQIPHVRREDGNAIAAAFRSGQTRVVAGGPSLTGAVVVPVLTPTGCGAVLALELGAGDEHDDHIHATAAILAAQLSMLCEPLDVAPPVIMPATRSAAG